MTALHTVRQPLVRTAYQAHGELARLLAAPDLHFDFERVATVTPSDMTRLSEILSELARIHDVITSYSQHPWYGVQLTKSNFYQLKSDIRSHFGALVRFFTEGEEVAGSIAKSCGVSSPSNLSETDRLIILAALIERTPHPPATWFLPDSPPALIEAAKHYQIGFDSYHERRNALMETYNSPLFLLPQAELILRLTERHKPLLSRVLPNEKLAADALIDQRHALQHILNSITEMLDRLTESLPALAASCNLTVPTTLAASAQLCNAAKWIAHNPKPVADWFSRVRLVELKTQAEEASSFYSAYCHERDLLKARYQDTFLSLDISGMYSRFTGSYTNPLRLLNPGYYRDLRQIRAELRSPDKIAYDVALHDLRTARQVLERKQWITTHTSDHVRFFGRHYNGLDTQWPAVLDAVETMRQLIDCLGETQISPGLRRLLIESDSAIESVGQQRAVVQAELTRLEQELTRLQQIISLQGLPFTNKPLREADLRTFKSWIVETANSLADFLTAWDAVASCRRTKSVLPEQLVAGVVKDLQEAQALIQIETDVQNHADELRNEFGHLFTGMTTRWEDVLAALDWTGQVLEWFGTVPPAAFVAVASGQQSSLEDIPTRLGALRTIRQRIDEGGTFLYDLFSTNLRGQDDVFVKAPIASLRAWVQLRLDRLSDLDKWIDFQNLRVRCQQAGLRVC